jgi:hypothetical protein
MCQHIEGERAREKGRYGTAYGVADDHHSVVASNPPQIEEGMEQRNPGACTCVDILEGLSVLKPILAHAVLSPREVPCHDIVVRLAMIPTIKLSEEVINCHLPRVGE